MIAPILAAIGWICLLAIVFVGLCRHARRLAGSALLTRGFVAELVAASLAFALINWGLPLAGLAYGVRP